jgi:hypothetical protein
VKARWLDNGLQNKYKKDQGKKIRSQIEIYQFLNQKNTRTQPEMAESGPVTDKLIPT